MKGKKPYHFSQGVGAIPDVGLLEVDLSEAAGLMGIGSHPCPFWRQGTAEKKRETATAAENDPYWEAPGQGVQGSHGSRLSQRLQLQHSALMKENSVSIREREQGQRERGTQAVSLTFAVILDVLWRRWGAPYIGLSTSLSAFFGGEYWWWIKNDISKSLTFLYLLLRTS